MLLDHGRETIATTALDAEPELILEMPEDTMAPLALAVGVTVAFVGMLLKTWLVVVPGAAITALALLAWLWPRRELREREAVHE
jgi:hypothetical protein